MKKLFLLFLLSPLLSATPHKFYVSKTIIEHNPRSGIYEITCKLFTDDLELAIGGTESQPIRLGTGRESSNADNLIENYLREHLKIRYNDVPVFPTFVGKEADADLTYCYLEFVQVSDYNTITIENTIFYELFPEQQNIVDLRANASSKTIILTKERSKEVIYR